MPVLTRALLALIVSISVTACSARAAMTASANGDSGYLTTADGVRLFYTKIGRGAQALIVPNGIGYVRDFEPLARDRTIIFFDVRNRGRSAAAGGARVAKGIRHDVDDLDAVRQHFGLERVDVLGHSYQGMTAVLYALAHPARVNRIVQIGAIQPVAGKAYAPSIAADQTASAVMTELAAWRAAPKPSDPIAACRQFWSILSRLYVVDAAGAGRLDWGRCDLENERNALSYLNEHIFPSIQALGLSGQDLARVTQPALVIHGTHDRAVPLDAAKDWAALLGNARLLIIDNAGHAPWIEKPDEVLGAIRAFLSLQASAAHFLLPNPGSLDGGTMPFMRRYVTRLP